MAKLLANSTIGGKQIETTEGSQAKVNTHASDTTAHITATERTTWNGKAGTAVATTSANGLMSTAFVTKLNGIATNANNYSHPTGDGNLHVPATGTDNNGKVLKAGATAGSLSWGTLGFGDMSDVSITSPTANQTLNFNGTAWVNSSTPNAKAFLNEGLRTAKSTAANQWTRIASISLTAQNQVAATRICIIGGEDSGARGTTPIASIAFRVTQSAAMASAPIVDLTLMENQNITITEFMAVTSTNTSASTVVDLYIKIVDINEIITFVPLLVNGFSYITFYEAQTLVTTLPTGTQTAAVYDTVETAALPSATTAVKGIVQLSSATNSTSTTLAATASAVKAAYDLANGKAGTAVATTTTNGLMSSEDKVKLDGISGTGSYTHPTGDGNLHVPATSTTNNGRFLKAGATEGAISWVSIVASDVTQDANNRFVTDTEKTTWNAKASTAVVTTSANGLMIAADKSKLDGIAASANNYVHPANHDPSIITQDANNRFVTDTEKATWNAKASTTVATTSANGLMSSTDKSKLDGIATSANNYSHPTGDGNLHVPATSTTNNGRFLKAGSTAGSISWVALTKTDVGLANADNTSDANKPVSTATQTALNLKANLASPTFTGTPLAPTASVGTNTTQIATTAFVVAEINNIPIDRKRKITISTSDPSGGSDGDVWLKYS